MIKTFCTGFAIIAVLALFFITGSCKKKDAGPVVPAIDTPHIQYAGTQTFSAVEGQTINFNSVTTNATSYLWNFGDGDTATTPDATHVYLDTGTFTVTFIPYNVVGAGSKSIHKIAVSNPGWWSFKSVRYYPDDIVIGSGTGNWSWAGDCNIPDSIATLRVWFYSATPTGPGTYIVTNGTLTAQNQVYVTYQVNGLNVNPPLQSTGGNGQQVVNVYNYNGTLAIAGTNIELVNTANANDKNPVTFDMVVY